MQPFRPHTTQKLHVTMMKIKAYVTGPKLTGDKLE
jgi:hypothetical protein